MKAKAETIHPSKLVLNYDIYPRHQIDSTNVRNIQDARESGASLPPVIAWRKNKWVIDGFHRTTDAMRSKLEEIAVEWRDYRNESEAFEEAIRLNAHGRQLAPYDKARCAQIGEALSIDPARLANALGLTVERLSELTLRKTAIGEHGAGLIPIKATLGSFAGKPLSSKQVEGNRLAGGMYPLAYVNQVINLIQNDLIDTDNENLMAGLVRLDSLLSRFVKRKAKRKLQPA